MKNRKLFAIITLVAFMLTMMPLMAFADEPTYVTATGSSISVDKATAKIGNNTALEFILDLDGNSGVKEKSQVVVFAERSGSLSDVDTIAVYKGDTKVTEKVVDGTGYVALNTEFASGEYTLKVTSGTAGTVALKAYVVTGATIAGDSDVAQVYNGSSDIIKKALVGNGCTGKFNPANGEIEFTTTVDSVEVTEDSAACTISANNGANGGTAKFNVKVTKGGSKVVGEKVTVSVDKSGASINETELTTSATGKVEFKVTASKPGNYKVTVECGNHSETYKVTATDTGISKMNITYTVNGTIATDNKTTVALMLAAYDNNGNLLDPATIATGNDWSSSSVNKGCVEADEIGGAWKVKVDKAPADSSLEGEPLTFYYGTGTCDQLFVSFAPDAAGEYVIKVFNDNTGATAKTTIKAAEFGTADHAVISYASSVYSLGEKTPAAVVDLFDQNGVKKSVNDSAKKFSYTGLGVAKFDADNGAVTFKADSDYTGKEVVVSTVVNNKFSASTTLTIAAEPAALKFTDATAEVGTDANVKVQIVDVNGNDSALADPQSYDVELSSAIITEKPEGATASVDAESITTNKQTFLKKGTSTVKIASNKEGTVKANVVVKLTAKNDVIRDGITYNVNDVKDASDKVTKKANPYTFYLSGVATATFGAKAPEKGTGDTVTFIIGNTTFVANGATKTADVAPYVANGRTFIPVRAFAEATGAKVEYDAATQVITITGEGLSAQMTIGSNILTVNGQTTVMDTAAAVTAEGRTVLPVRFAGQALGYGFEVAYGANGAVSSVTMFK